MKKLLFLIAIVAVFVACEKSKSMDAYDWEGAYTLETTSEVVYADGTREFLVDINDAVSVFSNEMTIYKRGGTLYAQTQYFGTPDTTLQGAYWCYAPQRRMLMNSMANDSAANDSVEPLPTVIVVENRSHIFLWNGFAYIKKHGNLYAAPIPAKAKSSSPNTLAFYPSQPFDIEIIPNGFNSNYAELDPANFDIVTCQYIYGDIQKSGNETLWDITLHLNYSADFKAQGNDIVLYIFHNKVIKK